MKKIFLLISFSFLGLISIPQTNDSTSRMSREKKAWTIPDSAFLSPLKLSNWILPHHPYYNFKIKPAPAAAGERRTVRGKELVFYGIILLLIIFGVLRRVFPRYFSNLFRLFFRTTLNQRQLQEQLAQTPLPSLLLNIFFVLSGALYCTFLIRHFNIEPLEDFWLLYFYCVMGLTGAYIIKFIGLKISGWLFNMQHAASSYVFIVFIVNKMLGILLLPFLLLIAFSTGNIYSAAITASWLMIIGLLGYRFVLTYATVRDQIKVHPFHFLLYLLAFEVAPLLLVYKGLLFSFGLTT